MKLSTTMMINETLLPTNKKAFTLAEVLITLSILGVVAAMTIPTLVNRQSDIAAQTRLKKAISNYHDMVEVYFIESGDSDAHGLFEAACANAGEYFKMTEQDGCEIVTADGAFWVIQQNTGNAWVYDAKESPRYGVFMWNANGFVNSDQCNDNGFCGTAVRAAAPDPAGYTNAPVNGFFNAKEFLASTGADLKAKAADGARSEANAGNALVEGNANAAANEHEGTGLANDIAPAD